MVRKVVHITTAHARDEVRIFLKECISLISAGYEVHLIVADGLDAANVRGVHIHDTGVRGGRFQRIFLLPWRMWAAARAVSADLYHLHEPELLLIALLLRISGGQVVYDSHEDTPCAILSRNWIWPGLRRLISTVFESFENFVARRVSAVVGATPHIAHRFLAINSRSVAINNFPLRCELDIPYERVDDGRSVCYIGGISRARGAIEMVHAIQRIDARLILAGPFESVDLERDLRQMSGWAKVDYRGVVSRVHVGEIMSQSSAGLLFFHPEPNHMDAQPNKMFEYMAAGLPVLASDFPLWRSILDEAGAARFADPLDPDNIARVIADTLADPAAARLMGERGRTAVLDRFHWDNEAQKLLSLYQELLPP